MGPGVKGHWFLPGIQPDPGEYRPDPNAIYITPRKDSNPSAACECIGLALNTRRLVPIRHATGGLLHRVVVAFGARSIAFWNPSPQDASTLNLGLQVYV